MASQAQDLMATFADVTRQHKFMYLRVELDEWDRLSVMDLEGAKERLKWVLQQISERPVSDMDWTPNDVSLEEVGHGTVRENGDQGETSDEMDLD